MPLTRDAGDLHSRELLWTLDGVLAATKAPSGVSLRVREWIQSFGTIHDPQRGNENRLSKDNSSISNAQLWFRALSEWQPPSVDASKAIARLTIAVTELKRIALNEQDGHRSGHNVTALWPHISETAKDHYLQQSWTPSRSAQGFVALPLCSHTADNKIVELIRLHVWMPDGQRGNNDFAIHSHQPFAQSWILAGEAADYRYDVSPALKRSDTTHSEYRLSWNTGKGLGKEYSPHQQLSTVLNSHVPVKCEQVSKTFHGRDSTYSIPSGIFHRTQVHAEAFHATLFFFDANRGFLDDAPVLGPVDGDSFTQIRQVAGVTPSTLADQVLQSQEWERCIEEGEHHSSIANWEHAKQSFDHALTLSGAQNRVLTSNRYRAITLGYLGCTNRRFGRYAPAADLLRTACEDLGDSVEKIRFSGELGTIYRHLGQLERARASFQMQYTSAKALGLEQRICHAIGNLGMVNYQLWKGSRLTNEDHASEASDKDLASKYTPEGSSQEVAMATKHQSNPPRDDALLSLAITQLYERLEICKRLKQGHPDRSITSGEDVITMRQIDIWAAVGFSRLSLCLVAQGELDEALSVTRESLQHSKTTDDPTVVAMSHFFHGLAFKAQNKTQEAFEQFNTNDGCTPAIAFCKEPSKEHLQYLEMIIDAGSDLTLPDSQGYTALDYAVFNSDKDTVGLVLRGLRQQLQARPDVDLQIHQRQIESKLRKGYREVFQDLFRPLLRAATEPGCIGQLRAEFCRKFHSTRENSQLFDSLRTLPYLEFVKKARLPSFADGLTREWTNQGLEKTSPPRGRQIAIFFSYRWLHTKNDPTDDEKHTQYNRMRRACETFMRLNNVDAEDLFLWIDVASIDQRNSSKGVAALPIIVAQCDVVISLIDDEYYTRAWCAVEAMLIQQLCRAYGFHKWYEQVDDRLVSGHHSTDLNPGPLNQLISASEKKLSFEVDREKILFLERQTNLLK